MMNNTHILDPVMHMAGASRPGSRRGKRGSAVASLLERLGICRNPRILNAICLTGENPAAATRP